MGGFVLCVDFEDGVQNISDDKRCKPIGLDVSCFGEPLSFNESDSMICSGLFDRLKFSLTLSLSLAHSLLEFSLLAHSFGVLLEFNWFCSVKNNKLFDRAALRFCRMLVFISDTSFKSRSPSKLPSSLLLHVIALLTDVVVLFAQVFIINGSCGLYFFRVDCSAVATFSSSLSSIWKSSKLLLELFTFARAFFTLLRATVGLTIGVEAKVFCKFFHVDRFIVWKD